MNTEMATGQASNSDLNGVGQRASHSLWLVDDDVESRQLCANILRMDGGFECPRQYGSAEAVIDALRRSPGPELLLLEATSWHHLELAMMGDEISTRSDRKILASLHDSMHSHSQVGLDYDWSGTKFVNFSIKPK